ncbi:hypothetical protein [Leifsonia sp. EB34]|uniref:hypothetical protein n=1 Tax=Leifsonia sp. EB34 TaxID=3156303 RepID=UPI0035183FE0
MNRAARPRTSVAASAALVAVALLLAGCTSTQVKPAKDYAGEPQGVQPPASSAGGAAWATWLQNGKQFGIVLNGSSTCPPTVQSVKVVASNQLEATLAPASGGVCTHDIVPHTTVFDTPSGLTTSSDVTVKLPDTTLTIAALRG